VGHHRKSTAPSGHTTPEEQRGKEQLLETGPRTGREATAATTKVRPPNDWRGEVLHVVLILLAGVLVRIPFHKAYDPVWSGDSHGYTDFYRLLTQHIFILGERTPVYPLFLGLAKWLAAPSQAYFDWHVLYVATVMQSVVGVVLSTLMFYIMRALRLRTSIAMGASVFLVTVPAVCMYEMNILNMSLSFSLLVLVVALFFSIIKRVKAGRSILAPALGAGAAMSLAVLNRPELLVFAVLLLLMMVTAAWCWRRKNSDAINARGLLRAAVFMAAPTACAVFGWMLLMYIGIGQFRITTLDGWNSSRTVYNLFDRVAPEDRAIGSLMSEAYLLQFNRHADVNLREIMWQAEKKLLSNYESYPITKTAFDPTYLNRPGIRFGRSTLGLIQVPCNAEPTAYCWQNMRRKIDVGDYLGRVSWKLARNYPREALHNVVQNYFEESFNFHYLGGKPAIEGYRTSAEGGFAERGSLTSMTVWAVNAEAPLLVLFYLVTLGFFFLTPVLLLRKADEHWVNDIAVSALAVASVGTMVATCVLAGFNRIYSLPHIVVFTICAAYALEHRSRILAAIIPSVAKKSL
jgi:hypothetical protein